MLSHFSHVQLFAALWTAARQAPLSVGFSMQEYWSGLPLPQVKIKGQNIPEHKYAYPVGEKVKVEALKEDLAA